jgi:hypothetical protein
VTRDHIVHLLHMSIPDLQPDESAVLVDERRARILVAVRRPDRALDDLRRRLADEMSPCIAYEVRGVADGAPMLPEASS